jgi:hypothetical protein
MGNEFGHPEWIDVPREGSQWSHRYAHRPGYDSHGQVKAITRRSTILTHPEKGRRPCSTTGDPSRPANH